MTFLPALRGLETSDLPMTGRRSGRKDLVLTSSYYGTGGATGTAGRPWPIDRAVREAFARSPHVFRATNTYANAYSRLPFQVLDGAQPVEDHPLMRLLNGKANPLERGAHFRKRVSQQVTLSPKGAAVEVTLSNAGTPMRLDLLPIERTRLIPSRDGGIDHWEVKPAQAGGKPRPIDAEDVLWFRDAHPLDPYSSMTWLESAGLSIEMDYFARLLNRSFLANDGRPGGILAIMPEGGPGETDGGIDEAEMDRLERKFGGGPVDAGRIVVLEANVKYIDTAMSPRDGEWGATSDRARAEVFEASGVPLSIGTDAAGQTFDNAGQDAVNFWTGAMPAHLDLCLTPFGDLLDDDGLTPALDMGKVLPVWVAEASKREEWRSEFSAGLRTANEYRTATGMTPMLAPGANVLWLASSIPFAGDEDAVQASAALTSVGAAVPPQPGGDPGDGGDPTYSGANAPLTPPPPPRALTSGSAPYQMASYGYASDPAVLALEGKAAATQQYRPDVPDDDTDEAVRTEVEDAVAAVLTAEFARAVEASIGRVSSASNRRGTRHERPGALATKALPVDTAIEPTAWASTAQDAVTDTLTPYAAGYAERMADYLADDGVDVTQPDPTDTAPATMPPPGPNGIEHPLIDAAVAVAAVEAGRAMAARVDRLRDRVRRADDQGLPMEDIVAALRGAHTDDPLPRAADGTGDVVAALRGIGDTGAWARAVATGVTTSALEGARSAVLRAAGNRIERTWRTRRDTRVRHAHHDAEGQTVTGAKSFIVGGEEARYPGDPRLSAGNRIGCRCRLGYKVRLNPQAVETKSMLEPAAPVDALSGEHIRPGAVATADGLTFQPAEHTHARCRHGEVRPVTAFPSGRSGRRSTECRHHRTERRKAARVPDATRD